MSARMFGRIKEHGSFGQSLVETALFLPLLIFLIAGVLELSNLLVTQNRVTSAARAGTRFAAANFGDEQWAAWNTYAGEVANVALNNVTETLDLDPARWDMWVIKATIAVTTSTDERWFPSGAWNAVHVDDGDNYGVMPLAEWTAREAEIQQEILDALETVPNGTEIVATDAYHHRNAFLGLAPYNLGPFTRIRGLTVMRVDDSVGTYGSCDTFPIGLSLNNYALHPFDATTVPVGHERYPFDPNAAASTYTGGGYHWPLRPPNANVHDVSANPPPVYTNLNRAAFPYNQPGRYIEQAQRGDIFLIKQVGEAEPSAFGWLRWDDANNAVALSTSLTWPGNSQNYYHPYGDFPEEGRINIFDLVRVNTGVTNASHVREQMREHVDLGVEGRLLRLIVFTPAGSPYNGDANGDGYSTGGTGSTRDFEVYAFVLGRIVAWKLTNASDPVNPENWLIFEFHGWDVDCAPSPPAYP